MPIPDPVNRSQDGTPHGTPQRRRPVQFNKAAVLRELFEGMGNVDTFQIRHEFAQRTGGEVNAAQINNIRMEIFQPDDALSQRLRTAGNFLIYELGLEAAIEFLNECNNNVA